MTNLSIDNNLLLIISCIIFLTVVVAIILIVVKNKKDEMSFIEEDTDEEDLKEIEEIEKENLGETKTNLEEVLEHMQANLDAKPEEVVQTFEREQEDKAIISYKELVRVLKEGETLTNLPKMNKVEFDDEEEVGNDLHKMVDKVKVPMSKDSMKKFKSSDFISPVYGKDKKEIKENIKREDFDSTQSFENVIKQIDDYKLDDYIEEFNTEKSEFISLEQTLDLDPLTDDVKQNEDFLQALKEFREHL